jgi:serine/threonine-protein kinase
MESTPGDKTIVQQVVGTPAFMAPETVLNPGDADARSDLFSLGAVAYWMLTGRLIYDGATRVQALFDQVRTLPPPPSERTETEIPEALDALILRCLAPDPRGRPQSAAEMAESLRAIRVTTSWTPQRAENWWRAHRPATVKNRPAPQLSGEAA